VGVRLGCVLFFFATAMWDGYLTVLLNPNLGTVLLVFSTFTLTYKDEIWAKLARIAVAPFIIFAFLEVGFGDTMRSKLLHPPSFQTISVRVNACRMVIRAIDLSIISLYDASPPHWVSHRSGKELPLPTTLGGRLLYTFDLYHAIRGSSFIPDRHWDFATSHVAKYRSPYSSKWSFIWSAIVRATGFYLVLDVSDTLVKRYVTVNPASSNPLFELPIAIQCLGGVHIALFALCSLSLAHNISAIVFVGTGLISDLDLWPPLFNQPFLSPSLSYFWSRGWHLILRRNFERLSILLIGPVNRKATKDASPPSSDKSNNNAHIPPSHRFGTVVISFMVSALIHGLITQDIFDDYENPKYLTSLTLFQRHPDFFFFAVQPVGIAIDRLIARFGDSAIVRVARRLWAWVFLLWTSRWMADAFAKSRFLGGKERNLPLSPVRGVLFGNWIG